MAEVDYTELLVLRHGQSEADVAKPKIFEGRLNTRLTDAGLLQARLAAEWIAAKYRPQRIISSPLDRAKATAEEVGRRASLSVEYDEDPLERNNGELAGLTEAQAAKKGFLPLEKYRPHETVPGGESLIAFRARAEVFWSKLLSWSKPGQRILIVSHGQMIAMLFRCFLKLPLNDYVQLGTGNTGIHCWRVDAKGQKVVFTNARVHLELGKASE